MSGSINTYISKPGVADPGECPPVFYGTAFDRFLIWLWRMRLTRPLEDILQHCDDIEAAFRSILYNPELAIAFAYVFGLYLIFPVGQVFGSRSTPSFFSITSDLRAYLASTHPLVPASGKLLPLAANAVIKPLPADWLQERDLQQACPDPKYAPLSAEELQNFVNCTFVDDNGIAAYRSKIREALHQSVIAAFELYGFPGIDRRDSCLSDEK